MTRATRRRAAFISAGLLFSAATAHAVDGVIEINQTSALVTGFPVPIAAPGSYRLTGNLTPPVGVSAINVIAPNVQIDLNGFSIMGGGGVNIPGIAGGPPGLVVHGGQITGFSGAGIVLGPASQLFRMHITTNGGAGVDAAVRCLIEDSEIVSNGGPGIIGDGCKIENNIIQGNVAVGILSVVGNNVIVHNRIVGTNGQGINIAASTLVSENTISTNVKAGVICSQSCTVRGNVIESNGLEGADVGPGSNVTGNSISFNATIGLDISTMSGFSNNTMHLNGGPEVFPAAHPTRLFDNICDGAVCP